jgi:TusA-related sulfurtransferase
MSEPDLLDLTGVPCPRNAARAILRLETMDEGDLLDVVIDDGEPLANVPPALEAEGHVILARTARDGRWILRVRRG